MFDTITGLPLHPLVIHGVVVGVPLMAVLTVLVAVRKDLRERFAWWVAGANFLLFLLTLVAKESGEALQAGQGRPAGHRARSVGQRPCPGSRWSSHWPRRRSRPPAATRRSARSRSCSPSSRPSLPCTGRSAPVTPGRAQCGGNGTLTG